mmetsp:Transcript_29308/g.41263  ORF Transcript_29308/g.41263 Transcript_29308/m.41263 type:complete len:562 (+) Transcript_29308:238-1923(+)
MGNTTSVASTRSSGQSRNIPKASDIFAQQSETDTSEINSKSSSGNNSQAPSLNGSISKATSQNIQPVVSTPSTNYQNTNDAHSVPKNTLTRTLSNVTITIDEDEESHRDSFPERTSKVGFQTDASEPLPIPTPKEKKRLSAKVKSVKMTKKEQQEFLLQLKKAADAANSSGPDTPSSSLPDSKIPASKTLSFSNEITGTPDDDLRVNADDVDHLKNLLAQKANAPPSSSPSGSPKDKKSMKSFTTRVKGKPSPTSSSRPENLVHQLREQMAALMEENTQKDHQIEAMKNALIEKEQIITELTEKMMHIRNNIQTFTQQKNKQVQELQKQLKFLDQQHKAAMEENEQAEDELHHELEELNERLFKTERENEQLSSEVDYWRQHALSFKKRLEAYQREADSDTHSDNGSYHRSNSTRSLSMSESEENNNGSPLRTSHSIEDQLDLENIVNLLRQKEQAITDLQYELHATRRKLSISEESASSAQDAEMEQIKKEYFFALAVGLKLGNVNNNKGVPNLNIENLWERAIQEKVDRKLWKKWIQAKMDEELQGKASAKGFAFSQPN